MTVTVVEGSTETLARILVGFTDAAPPRVMVVHDESSAAAAVLAALDGGSLVVHSLAERSILDRLYDDLRRIGDVTIRTGEQPSRADLLATDESALLRQLAAGETLREAAAALHISLRTSDRRLASARTTLGASTTAEAVRVFIEAERR